MAVTPYYLLFLIRTGWIAFIDKQRSISFSLLVISQSQCTFDRPILGDYYSYENGLETHTSFQITGEIARLFYRRQSGLGATAGISTILDHQAIGECIHLNWRENPAQHISKQHYELISRDKLVSTFAVLVERE